MVLVCMGTRPEVIKLAPILSELSRSSIPFKILFTGQHLSLFEDVKDLIPTPSYHLSVMKTGQSLNQLLVKIIYETDQILEKEAVRLVILQGDTTTVLGCALAAFNRNIPIGHVEAGLRTYSLQSPFPEEANRQLVSRIANVNWAPTQAAADNLKNEGVKNINMTGNTIIDACSVFDGPIYYGKKVMVTLHRRENFGTRMEKYFREINDLASENMDLDFIFPMHPNPEVQKLKHLLTNVSVIPPLDYLQMLSILAEVCLVITDSGGIQEECAYFKKKAIVCRDTTERQESLDCGLSFLCPDTISQQFDQIIKDPIYHGINPYGDGKASIRIVEDIKSILE